MKIEGICRAETVFVINTDAKNGLLRLEVQSKVPDAFATKVVVKYRDDSMVNDLTEAGYEFRVDIIVGRFGSEELSRELQGRLDGNVARLKNMEEILAQKLN